MMHVSANQKAVSLNILASLHLGEAGGAAGGCEQGSHVENHKHAAPESHHRWGGTS
jgi:hypothetical protein